MRDPDMKKGSNSLGFSSGFTEWYEDNIRELSQQDRLKKIKDHLEKHKIYIEVRRMELGKYVPKIFI